MKIEFIQALLCPNIIIIIIITILIMIMITIYDSVALNEKTTRTSGET